MSDTVPITGQNERWAQVEAAFTAVLDTPPEGRESLLASLCADKLVRAEVLQLLLCALGELRRIGRQDALTPFENN